MVESKLKSNLRLLMAHHKIDSVTELMKKSKLSRNAIKKILKEENLENAKLETFLRLCDTFSCPLSDLIEYTPKDFDKEKWIKSKY